MPTVISLCGHPVGEGQRLFVIAGGPLANYLAAMAIAFGLLAVGGEPTYEPRIREVMPNSAAAAAGLQRGDLVVRVEGAEVRRWSQLVDRVAHSGGRALPFVVERNGQRVALTVTPRLDRNGRDY